MHQSADLAARHPAAAERLRRCSASEVSRSSNVARRSVRAQSAEHSRYVMEVGVASHPENMDTLIQALKAQGQEIVSPDERGGLHPLAIPLARGPSPEGDDADASVSGDVSFTCLLRWPASAAAQGLPVVRMSSGAPAVSLLARSAEEYLKRALAEEEQAVGGAKPGAVSAALGASAARFYEPGSTRDSGLPSLEAWLTRQGAMFPDAIEELVAGHLARGDEMSAMITGEWYMKRAHFPGWARPYEFNAQLLSRLRRPEEARDSARVALYTPWWTLRDGFGAAAALAELPADAAELRRLLSEVARAGGGRGALPPSIAVATKTDEQLAVEEAEALMNLVAAGERRWDDIRPELADWYTQGGCAAVADFIRAAG